MTHTWYIRLTSTGFSGIEVKDLWLTHNEIDAKQWLDYPELLPDHIKKEIKNFSYLDRITLIRKSEKTIKSLTANDYYVLTK